MDGQRHLFSTFRRWGLVFLLLGSSAPAAPAPEGRIWVHIGAGPGTSAWKAQAMEDAYYQYLSGVERLRLAEDVSPKDFRCRPGDLNCLLRAARAKGIDIVVLGDLTSRTLRVKSYETWSRTQVVDRSLTLSKNIGLTEFRHRVFQQIKPFVELGGILDHRLSRAGTEPSATPPAPQRGHSGAGLTGMLMLAALFWLPRLSVRLICRRLKSTFTEGRKTRARVLVLSLLLPLAWLAAVQWGDRAPSFLPLAGGIAWASLLVIVQRFSFTAIQGMEGVNHFTLSPLLRAWVATSFAKLLSVAAALLPFVLAANLLGRAAEMSVDLRWGLVVPLSAIAGCLWYLLWVEYLTLFIDRQIVFGSASPANPWHPAIQKYVRGYLNRIGIALDESFLEKTLFLPGRQPEVRGYGGGWTRPRVVIPSAMLEYALKQPARSVGSLDLESPSADPAAGLILPRRKTSQTQETRKPFRFPFTSRKPMDMGLLQMELAPGFNHHGSTLLGYILPSPTEQTAPLIANNREDYKVLAELLTGHYAQFAQDLVERELDDTDPTAKDFLFGAIVREQGALQQRTPLISTGIWAFQLGRRALPKHVSRALLFFIRVYDTGFSKYACFVADAFAALNGARNHLAQYLYYAWTDRRKLLTSRADAAALYGVSKQILHATEETPVTPEDLSPFHATFRNRIAWLSAFFYGSIQAPSPRRLRRAVTAATVMILLGIGAAFIGESVTYRSTYLARVERMKERILKQEEEKKQKSPGHWTVPEEIRKARTNG